MRKTDWVKMEKPEVEQSNQKEQEIELPGLLIYDKKAAVSTLRAGDELIVRTYDKRVITAQGPVSV